MNLQTNSTQVNVPEVTDLAALYPQYAPFARADGKFLFDLIASPTGYINARVATEELALPAVAGIAKICYEAAQAQTVVPWNDFLKQYIGAVVSLLMQMNGFQKTRTKKAIPHPAFTKGEFYRR